MVEHVDEQRAVSPGHGPRPRPLRTCGRPGARVPRSRVGVRGRHRRRRHDCVGRHPRSVETQGGVGPAVLTASVGIGPNPDRTPATKVRQRPRDPEGSRRDARAEAVAATSSASSSSERSTVRRQALRLTAPRSCAGDAAAWVSSWSERSTVRALRLRRRGRVAPYPGI